MKQFICKPADLVGMDYSEIKQTVLCGVVFNWTALEHIVLYSRELMEGVKS